MSEERLGASFSIDITALKTGLAQANRLIKESNSEFKAAAAGLDDWTKSEEGLNAKLKNLNDVLQIQEKKVQALQKEYDDCINNGLDPMSAAAVKLRTDINNATADIGKTKTEINKYEKALDELGDGAEDAGEQIEDLSDSAKDSGDGFTIAKGAIADLISNGIQALAGACKNAISSIAGLADATRESRTAFAKLETSFDSAGLGAEAAEKTMNDLYGVLGDTDRATEASNLLAKMSKNQQDLDKNTRILTGVFAEYGDSIPTEGLAEAMASSSAMSSVQGVLADALEWQGVNLDEYNAKLGSLATEEERAAYIQETLTDLYGESADAYRDNNKELIKANEAQLDYQQTLNTFGDMVEPLATKVREGFTKILEKIAELTEDIDIEAFGEKIDKAFDGFINNVMPKIVDFLSWILDHGELIITIISAILAGFTAFKVVTGIIKAVSAAQAIWNAVTMASPITWITLGIAALVAAIVVLIRHWDDVKEAGKKAWEWIKNAWDVAATWFKEKVIDPVTKFFKELWTNVANFFKNLWSDVSKTWDSVANWFKEKVVTPISNLFSNLWKSLKETASDTWSAIKNVFKPVGEFFSGIWTTIKSKFTSIGTKIGDAIGGAFKSAINAVLTTVENAINKVPRTINAALHLINALPGVNIASLPEIKLPRLAKGGIVRGATTALIGENGAEAIVPLEKNTEWIDKVADKLSSKSGIVINQTNNYSQAHSRYELYKSKQQTAAAVRLALGV